MRVFIAAIILIFSFQSLVKADDIRDFQIEGMGIGDSLLDYMSKEEIINNRSYIHRGKKEHKGYSKVSRRDKNENYESVILFFKTNDQKFIIKAISGRIYYESNMDECYNLQKEIVDQIDQILSNFRKYDRGKKKLSSFPNGESYKTDISFYSEDGSIIHTACYDYSIKDTSSSDRLSVMISSKDYFNWFQSIK